MEIRLARPEDAAPIEDIYVHYVLHATCTFQEEPGTLDERRAWLREHGARHPVTVAVEGGEVVGWGALSPYHRRSAYRHTVEDSVYVRHDRHRRGVGRALLADLVSRARAAEHRLVVASVSDDQPASLELHRALGFVLLGTLPAAGLKFGRWIGVSFLYLELRAS
jgi:L-amino acid N-acyltransferase YncA